MENLIRGGLMIGCGILMFCILGLAICSQYHKKKAFQRGSSDWDECSHGVNSEEEANHSLHNFNISSPQTTDTDKMPSSKTRLCKSIFYVSSSKFCSYLQPLGTTIT